MEWGSQKNIYIYTGELAKNEGGLGHFTHLRGGVEGGDTPMHTVGTDNMGTFTR